MAEQYYKVANNRPNRSKFNLSYEKKFTPTFGKLYPILCDEVVPGDVWKLGYEAVVRSQPMLAPLLHRIDVKVEYFFVPYRLLWKDWEEFITGGEDGYTPITAPEKEPVIPVFSRVSGTPDGVEFFDYLFGVDIRIAPGTFNTDNAPLDFPRRAYNMIWYDYYRDENLQSGLTWMSGNGVGMPAGVVDTEMNDRLYRDLFVGIDITDKVTSSVANRPNYGREYPDALLGAYGNQKLRYRNWEKDFFTSALPWQQKGDTPALPVALSGVASVFADFDQNGVMNGNEKLEATRGPSLLGGSNLGVLVQQGGGDFGPGTGNYRNILADMSSVNATGFDIADFRLAFQVQRWLEQNARAGSRYTEFLRGHFGVSPFDSRLQRPEFIGSYSQPLIISEVLQTSESDAATNSYQGNMAGHGISVASTYIGSYHVEEFGLIMGLVSFMPKPSYMQGMNRQWLRRTPLDFYFPEFAHLSERAIENQEIYWTSTATSDVSKGTFGFQGMYDEMRVKQSMIHGLFRDSPTMNGEPGLGYWHLARYFDSMPTLSSSFIEVNPDSDDLMRPYPVTTEPPFLVSWANTITAIRPMPFMAQPGLIDHV